MTEQQMLRSDTSDSLPSAEEVWRDEIQARVARYRTRRGRRIEGTYSMRFPFGPEEQESPATSQALPSAVVEAEAEADELSCENLAAAADEWIDLPINSTAPEISHSHAPEMTSAELIEEPAETAHVAEPEPEVSWPFSEEAEPEPQISAASDFSLEPDLEPLPPPLPRPPAKRKIIAFPRQATNQEEVYRLADPVVPEQPRILDVPEELEPFPTTPLLEGLQLPAAQQSAVPSPDHIELPFQAASISRRLGAGLLDFAIVAAASAAFGAVAYKFLPNVQLNKPLILGVATVPVLLWAVYQYLMLMYAGTTAGMQVAKVRLSTFKGGAPNRRHRRSRVIGLYFSTASLMMGLLWSLVDVDTLCWHDRISHTYLTRRD
jgi:uncharacterized RDD family membrane protein YckC